LNDVLHGHCLAGFALIKKRPRAKIGKVQGSAKKNEKNDVSYRLVSTAHLLVDAVTHAIIFAVNANSADQEPEIKND
jgi:hypothetical protein